MNKNTQCPICAGFSILIHEGTRDNPDIDVYECKNCKIKFLSVLEDKDYENGFNLSEERIKTDEEIVRWLKVCEPDDNRRMKTVCALCSGKKVLDFGCGYGGFIKKIKDVASSCKGVELSRYEREYLNKNHIDCKEKIEEFQNEKFDVITLFHVFEHLNNPIEWLNKLKEYLAEDGTVVIEIPNANDVLLSIYKCKAFADFTYWSAHLFLYTEQGFKTLVKKLKSWKIEKIIQVQRYPLANHLMWLSRGIPGGVMEFMDSEELNRAYVNRLGELKACDTLMIYLKKVNS